MTQILSFSIYDNSPNETHGFCLPYIQAKLFPDIEVALVIASCSDLGDKDFFKFVESRNSIIVIDSEELAKKYGYWLYFNVGSNQDLHLLYRKLEKYEGVFININVSSLYLWKELDLSVLLDLSRKYPNLAIAGNFELPDIIRLMPYGFSYIVSYNNIKEMIEPIQNNHTERCKIFVKDHLVEAEIGVYKHEYLRKQKLKFNVVADITISDNPEKLFDTVSYDIIIDAISFILKDQHIELLETIADRLCKLLFKNPSILALNVKIEKLGIINGSVGVELTRYR